MKNNVVLEHPTHFATPTLLIEEAMKDTGITSENYCRSEGVTLGCFEDRWNYYGEIWSNGMDWTKNYWLLEASELKNPRVFLAIYFPDNRENDKFNPCDLQELFLAIMHHRRNKLWLNHDEYKTRFTDTVWPFITRYSEQAYKKLPFMQLHVFEHNSQARVEFYLNTDLCLFHSKRVQLLK